MTKFEALTEAQREAVCSAVAEALGDAMDCHRVWGAWRHGTMGEDDFSLVSGDPDRVTEVAAAAVNAIAGTTINMVPPSKDADVRQKGFAPVGVLYGRERERLAIDDHGRATWFSTNESGAYCALWKPERAEPPSPADSDSPPI